MFKTPKEKHVFWSLVAIQLCITWSKQPPSQPRMMTPSVSSVWNGNELPLWVLGICRWKGTMAQLSQLRLIIVLRCHSAMVMLDTSMFGKCFTILWYQIWVYWSTCNLNWPLSATSIARFGVFLLKCFSRMIGWWFRLHWHWYRR